ncbi:MAG: LpxL/LpxP family Kdo(2)-lipid IV(A) lauroyl/palmitoleoyl acyltransferase [Cellvibrionaceae bacterium]
MTSRSSSAPLWHPRYWLTWFGFLLLAILAQLPFRFQLWLGRCLGRLSYYLIKSRRRIAKKNIELCFPEKSAEEHKALVIEHFEATGMALFEMGMAWFMPYWRLKKRFVVKGQTHWEQLREQGTGALIITIHFTTLEIANVAINRLFNMYMSYRPHKNPVYDLIQRWGRERHNKNSGAIARRDIRGMVKALKQGDWLWYAPDQDYGRKVSAFVPWFGIETATVAAPPRLLRMAKVPAVAMVYRHLPDFSGYEIEFMPAFEGIPSGDDYADLVRINQHIESCVRNNPAEYLWMHRRFKTRPDGEAKIY